MEFRVKGLGESGCVILQGPADAGILRGGGGSSGIFIKKGGGGSNHLLGEICKQNLLKKGGRGLDPLWICPCIEK